MDFSTAANALSSVKNMSYLVIFLLFLVEGPIFNYVVAFAASLGFFDVFIIFFISVFGNFLGDYVYYNIGRIGKKTILKKYVHRKMRDAKTKKLINYMHKNPGKAMTIIKVTPGLALPGLVLAGVVKMDLKKFLFYSFLICTAYSIIMTTLGYYTGTLFYFLYSYVHYGIYLAGALVILCIFAWYVIKRLQKKIAMKIEKI
jgi:membrane protein DedA with SNARE-associated domain